MLQNFFLANVSNAVPQTHSVTHAPPETVMQLGILKINIVTIDFLKSDDREKLQVLKNQADLLVLAKEKKIKHY